MFGQDQKVEKPEAVNRVPFHTFFILRVWVPLAGRMISVSRNLPHCAQTHKHLGTRVLGTSWDYV